MNVIGLAADMQNVRAFECAAGSGAGSTPWGATKKDSLAPGAYLVCSDAPALVRDGDRNIDGTEFIVHTHPVLLLLRTGKISVASLGTTACKVRAAPALPVGTPGGSK